MSRLTGQVTHGTANGYNYYGCRCAACTEAWSATWKERAHRLGYRRPMDVYRAEQKANPPAHGTESRYASPWKCRCDRCREAARVGRRERKKRKG